MKANKFVMMAMMLTAACACMTSCSDDEKTPEMVQDPIKNTVEYYINGKVSEGTAALAGVTVDVNGTTATTDANGLFSITVTEKGNLTLKASKEGYLNVNNLTVTVPDNAGNRSSYSVNFGMTAKGTAVELPEGENSVLVTTESATANADMSSVANGTGVEIPADAMAGIAQGTKVTMTQYVPEQETADATAGDSDISSSVMNVYIESNNEIDAKGIKLALKNPVETNAVSSFKQVEVYSSTGSRAGSAYSKLGEATLNPATNAYEYELPEGKLAGDYSFRIKAHRSIGATQEESVKSDKVDNSGNFEAKNDVEITYTAPAGWEYASGFDSSLDAELVTLMQNAVAAQEGAEGTHDATYTQKTNISGNYIMYYNAKSTYTTTTYTFELTDRNVSVEVKKYTGTKLEYVNESADQHSGGTSH